MAEPALSLRNIETVYKVILAGTYGVVAVISILVLADLVLGHKKEVFGSLVVCGMATLYVVAVRMFANRGWHMTVAYLLVTFYALLAAGIVGCWGVNTPMGLLLFCVVIVLAGILLSARHALFAAGVASLTLLGIQTALVVGWHRPDMSWMGQGSTYNDVLGSCVIFGMLALISWLYNREMERSLRLAKEAQNALSRQKVTLRQQVEKRTEQLRHVQLEEMQQMYRFAELGQWGVTLLHDLANHLTVLTLEIEGLQSPQNSNAIARTQEITKYLEEIVDSTRSRLQGDTQTQPFNIIRSMSEVIEFLNYKAAKAKVAIDWRPPARTWTYVGDPTCFSQVVAIIISNAIDAYGGTNDARGAPDGDEHRVGVSMSRSKTHIIVTISDWGRGIPKGLRKYLFKPFHTTKKKGLGIGLFIAQQTVVTNFGGTIALNPRSDHTEFIIKLPLTKK